MLNPYEVLGISPSCSEEEAKSKYKQLVKKYHPDGSNGDVNKFREIHLAWKKLQSLGGKAFNRGGSLTHISLFKFRRL